MSICQAFDPQSLLWRQRVLRGTQEGQLFDL
jgi:hypothetical protein